MKFGPGLTPEEDREFAAAVHKPGIDPAVGAGDRINATDQAYLAVLAPALFEQPRH